MGQLGGGGAQTAWGYQSVSPPATANDGTRQKRVGIAAGVGPDVPLSCLEWLEGIEVDISGIQQCEGVKTPRAWQILEQDGRRHEIWRTAQSEEQTNLLLPPFSSLPHAFQRARAFHLGIHPEHPPMELLKDLRNALDQYYPDGSGLLSVETFTKATKKISASAALWEAVALCDIFSPNEEEARSILGLHSSFDNKMGEKYVGLLELTSPFVKAGARWCTLRRGSFGAVIHENRSVNAWNIPPVSDISVIDTTGCGNAFCGAFLAAIQDENGSGAEVAGMFANAAASVMAEHQGVPQGLGIGEVREKVHQRALCLETHVL